MRLVSATLLLAIAFAFTARATEASADVTSAFAEFKTKYAKTYSSPEEEARRFRIFSDNMKKARAMQALNPLAQFGVNGYSDLSEAEFKTRHSGEASFRAAIRKRASRVSQSFGETAPSQQQVDWRKKGAVTPIKNQMTCGGCWSFSTTGNIEGQWFLAGKGLHSLSEQELISCTDTCNGCHGGIMDDAFEWIINTRGGAITSEAQYPFVSGEGVVPNCDIKGKTAQAYISSYTDVAHSEASMANFVATKGPLSIAVDATSFQTYKGGILTSCTSNQVDHAVLIVGYDLSAPTPYWIVKNQWGTTWGEDGYIYLAYGSNQCLLTTLPSSSVVSNPPPLPPSGTPAPPSPPDVTNGTFTQYTCSSSMCLSGCTNVTLPNGRCLKLSNGKSAITSCGQQYLRMEQYNTSDCTGAWTQGMIPLNQCNEESNGVYLYDVCTTSGNSTPPPVSPSSDSGSSSNFDAPLELTPEEARHLLRGARA